MISEFTNPTEEETVEAILSRLETVYAAKQNFPALREKYMNKTCLVELGTGTDRRLETTNTIKVPCLVWSVVSNYGRVRAGVKPIGGYGSMFVDISKLGEPK